MPSYNLEIINEAVIAAERDQTLLEASLAAGIAHYHACGGQAMCSTCRVLVEEGPGNLTPPTEAEKALAEKRGFPPKVRLACQARVAVGKVRIHRIIRDEEDLALMPPSDRHEAAISLGEERELALFFLDIRNFTRFAETHLPYDVIHLLNRFHRIVHKTIEEHHGVIIEVAGDGLYAVFGMEEDLPAAVASAVEAGRAILDNLESFNDAYAQPFFEHRIAVGLGLHAGRVICGRVGIGIGGALSVIGYPVNVAARIESATKELDNNFLVSHDAFRLLPEPPENIPTAELNLKGVRETTRVHLLGQPWPVEDE